VVYHSVTLPLPKGITKIEGGERANIVASAAKAYLANGEIIGADGKASHASKPQEGDNAIVKLLKMLVGSQKSNFDLAKLAAALDCYYGSGVNLDIFDKESGRLTMNVGTVKTINGNLEFEIDIRHPITYDRSEIEKRLRDALPFCTVLQRPHFHLPLYVEENSFLIQSLLGAYNEVTGENAKPITIGGATYARAFENCVSFGPVFPCDKATIHQADECIALENYKKMQLIFYKAIEKLCF
jgi:succinyl-diaminopimelate desuccinylase